MYCLRSNLKHDMKNCFDKVFKVMTDLTSKEHSDDPSQTFSEQKNVCSGMKTPKVYKAVERPNLK